MRFNRFVWNRMFSNKVKKVRCFLCCCKEKTGKKLKAAQAIVCTGSKKPLKDVISYLASSAKLELKISKDTSLCLECCQKVLNFDANMMKIMKQKREILDLMQKAMTYLDSDFEEELHTCAILEEDNFSDVMPSDNEITETVEKVITAKNYDENNYKTRTSKRKFEPHITCHICETRFQGKSEYDKHMEEEHKKYKCNMCDFSHRNEDHVMLHKNIHEGRKETQCPFCYKEFSKKISTIRHMEAHMDSKKYQCDKCGLCFSQTTVLYNHRLQHEAEEEPLFCDICQQQFKTIRTYRRHVITHRADRPRYSCEHCGKSFTEKYTLKVHKRSHMEDIQTRQDTHNNIQRLNNNIQCNCIICDQLFINKEQLNRHMEADHDVILKSLPLSNFPES